MRLFVEVAQLVLILVVCRGQSYDFDFGNQKLALLELDLYEKDHTDYRTTSVKGKFAKAGPKKAANGKLLLMELNCSTYTADVTDEPWVGLVKLTKGDGRKKRCNSVIDKIKQAIAGGARAILLDVTHAKRFIRRFDERRLLDHPIILVQGTEARRLSSLLSSSSRKAYIRIMQTQERIPHRIPHPQKTKTNEYFDMGIFMAFFIFVSLICLILLIKIKWKQQRKQSSLSRLARHAISKMETRKYSSMSPTDVRVAESMYMSYVPSFGIRSCAICLEEFAEGQEIRIVPCRHEFHRKCVDPWLLANCTCPLCMLNIVEPLPKIRKVRTRRRSSIWHLLFRNRCISSNENQQSDYQIPSPSPFTPDLVDRSTNSRHIVHQAISAQTNSPRFPTSSSFSEHLRRASEINETSPVDRRINARPYRYHRCPLHQKNYRPVNVSTCDSTSQSGYWMGARLLDDNVNIPGPSNISNESCSSSTDEETRPFRSPWRSQYDNVDTDIDKRGLEHLSVSISQHSRSMKSLSCAAGLETASMSQDIACAVRPRDDCCTKQSQSSTELCCTGDETKSCTLTRKKMTLSENGGITRGLDRGTLQINCKGSTKSLNHIHSNRRSMSGLLDSTHEIIHSEQTRTDSQPELNSRCVEYKQVSSNKSSIEMLQSNHNDSTTGSLHILDNVYEMSHSVPYPVPKPRAVVVLSDISQKPVEEQIV